MEWEIIYFNKAVEDEVWSLPTTLFAQYLRLTKIMESYGLNIGMPHTKALGNSLFELRLKGQEGIARIFYCTMVHREIFILHSIIKKDQAIPLREMRLIQKRLKEVTKYVQKNT